MMHEIALATWWLAHSALHSCGCVYSGTISSTLWSRCSSNASWHAPARRPLALTRSHTRPASTDTRMHVVCCVMSCHGVRAGTEPPHAHPLACACHACGLACPLSLPWIHNSTLRMLCTCATDCPDVGMGMTASKASRTSFGGADVLHTLLHIASTPLATRALRAQLQHMHKADAFPRICTCAHVHRHRPCN